MPNALVWPREKEKCHEFRECLVGGKTDIKQIQAYPEPESVGARLVSICGEGKTKNHLRTGTEQESLPAMTLDT